MTVLSHLVFVLGFSSATAGLAISLAGLFERVRPGIAIILSRWLMAVSIVSLILFLYLDSPTG
jgi:uncharacterized membrane protein